MGQTFIEIQQLCSVDGTSCTLYMPSAVVGDIVFALAVLIFIQSFVMFGFLFNTFVKLSRRYD